MTVSKQWATLSQQQFLGAKYPEIFLGICRETLRKMTVPIFRDNWSVFPWSISGLLKILFARSITRIFFYVIPVQLLLEVGSHSVVPLLVLLLGELELLHLVNVLELALQSEQRIEEVGTSRRRGIQCYVIPSYRCSSGSFI